MIPSGSQLVFIGEDVEIENQADQPSYTYNIDFDKKRIIGMVDGLDAVKQAVYMIMNTKRFAHVIFSWDFGSELHRFIGEDRSRIESEIKQVITEALTADERITDVTNFKITYTNIRSAMIECDVASIFGETHISEEVTL